MIAPDVKIYSQIRGGGIKTPLTDQMLFSNPPTKMQPSTKKSILSIPLCISRHYETDQVVAKSTILQRGKAGLVIAFAAMLTGAFSSRHRAQKAIFKRSVKLFHLMGFTDPACMWKAFVQQQSMVQIEDQQVWKQSTWCMS